MQEQEGRTLEWGLLLSYTHGDCVPLNAALSYNISVRVRPQTSSEDFRGHFQDQLVKNEDVIKFKKISAKSEEKENVSDCLVLLEFNFKSCYSIHTLIIYK